MINKKLAKDRNIPKEDIKTIENIHTEIDNIFKTVEFLDPNNKNDLIIIKKYCKLLYFYEFKLQKLWKFDIDENKHSLWFRMPHCTCPKSDNYDMLSTYRWISKNCLLHNNDDDDICKTGSIWDKIMSVFGNLTKRRLKD